MDDSSDVEDGLGKPLHEELFEEISHDLARAEDLTVSTCMKIFASSEDPLSGLYVAFPYLVFNDSVGFICANCEGDSICQICAKIEACRRGDPLVPRDCDVACANSMIDDLAVECQDSAQEEFPNLFNTDDSSGDFSYDHYVGVELCAKSAAKVDDYLRDDKLENQGLTKQIQVVETKTIETILPTSLRPSVIQPLPLELESPFLKHFLGWNEYAYLENDA